MKGTRSIPFVTHTSSQFTGQPTGGKLLKQPEGVGDVDVAELEVAIAYRLVVSDDTRENNADEDVAGIVVVVVLVDEEVLELWPVLSR
jgi:hypothetical protein